MKTIKRANDPQEAKIIVGFLQAHGIDAELLDGAINGVLPMIGGLRIAVPARDEAAALRLLNEADAGATEIEDAP